MFQLVRPDRVKYTLSYTYTYNRRLKSIHIHIKINIMNEEETLAYWEVWLKDKNALTVQCFDEIGNANTIKEREFYYRVYDLIKSKH
jgi:hypothetical protein